MIKNTFQHIPGFTALKERKLWDDNILSWEDYERKLNVQLSFDFSNLGSLLDDSKKNLTKNKGDFFAQTLDPHEFYRIAHTFPEKTVFLDIETTGLSKYYNHITIVGWSLLGTYDVHIINDNTSKTRLKSAIEEATCIVTFNGTLFDLPFLKTYMPDLRLPKCHIDLRFFSRRVGLQGGQKIIEQELNFQRPEGIIDIDGHEATILWHRYKEGDLNSLKKLIEYNAYDVDGMKMIFEKVTDLLLIKEKSIISKTAIFPFSKYSANLSFSKVKKIEDTIFLPEYTGKSGPVIFLDDLKELRNQTVVGIDLTGSETKPSGWAYLKDGKAITKTILTDKEIISESLKLNPTLISIDSPLTLPVGRTSVFDNDPFREAFGITRECERIMTKRGVKSYPCLIQSMQKLTQRGIKLANEFRKLGYPVIESYPGAAQDILGIPRKSKSLEYLIKGLKSFGITGDFDKQNVTHDEIDAITSALVGYFFFAGKYEALGNEQEDYLIIPKTTELVGSDNLVIGFSGLLSAGKTTSAKILENQGFGYGRYSMVIDYLLQKEGKEIKRTNQQELGEYINKVKGQRWLGIELLKLVPDNNNITIDGLRFPEDHSFLKERYGRNFVHIHITSTDKIREERYNTKKINNSPFIDANAHNVENEIQNLRSFADFEITNNTTVEDLRLKLEEVIIKLKENELATI